jgi:sigma-E factor negative regulatory protein RseC
MAIEQGIVIKMGSQGSAATAWVKMVRSGACESCASRDSCKTGEGGQTQEVEALNPVNAKVGDRIQLTIGSAPLLTAMFLLYLFPVLCMLIGGLSGNWLGAVFQVNPSSMSVVSAVVCLIGAMFIVRIGGRRMAAKPAYRPKIMRVIGRELIKPSPLGYTTDTSKGADPGSVTSDKPSQRG